MKANKTLIFKIARVIIFLAVGIFSGIMLMESHYLNSTMFYSIFLIAGLVGLFLEIYKK